MVITKMDPRILALKARVIISGTYPDSFDPNKFGLSNVKFSRQGEIIEADLLLVSLSELSELDWVTGIGLHETTGTKDAA